VKANESPRVVFPECRCRAHAGTGQYVQTLHKTFLERKQSDSYVDHFTRYAPETVPYGITRYQNETKRLYSVLDKHLSEKKSPYLVGDKCTIADIAHWGWVAAAGWAGVDIDEFPALKAWEDRMAEREGVAKGKDVPEPFTIKERMKDKKWIEETAGK
jgi:glutathione S-transferase